MQDLKARTKRFARACFRVSRALPKSEEFLVMRRQLLRSASSAAANYRSACRGKSKADFIAKLSTVEEEADESAFWLEMIADELADLQLSSPTEIPALIAEAGELVAIMVASKKTARGR
jgi:four helix bundle protein